MTSEEAGIVAERHRLATARRTWSHCIKNLQ